MLIASIKGPTLAAALAEMEQARSLADFFEFRLDHFDEDALARIGTLVAASSLPLVFTDRKQEQGGNRPSSEKMRLQRIESLLAFCPAYCDIEADTDPQFIEKISKRVKLIGSYHNFEETPLDLNGVLHSLRNPHFSIYKIACMARSTIDLLRLMIFARENSSQIPLSCLSMGEFGQPSRVLGPVVGNAFDYTSLQAEAPPLFHLSLETLHKMFHYPSLNRDTEIFALLGDPIAHSPGHIFHNEIFQKESRNAVYVKLLLSVDELPQFCALFRRLPFKGLSVTIPLKEKILPLLDRVDSLATAIGAVNTVIVENGGTTGMNTDAPGALDAIEKHFKVKTKRVAILGAGGTARAIAFEAKRRGAQVALFNRTVKRGEELAARLELAAYPLEEIASHSSDLLINTIPPAPDGTPPIDFSFILRSTAVMDVALRSPKETPILKAAKERGCLCIYGDEMFVEQAILQQVVWQKK